EAAARVDLQAAWGVDALPTEPGRDTAGIVAAAVAGELSALVVGGVDPADLPDPDAALAALDAADFVVSLELRPGAVTERADVVLPVAPVAEKGGTFWTWEGRERPFGDVLASSAMSDYRVLDLVADEMDVALGLRDLTAVRSEAAEIAVWDGERVAAPTTTAAEPPAVGPNQAVLATWHLLLDGGRLQDGEPWLAGTARRPVARLSSTTAAEVGVADGEALTVSTERGALTLPVVVTPMPDRAVWLPTHQTGHRVRATLGVDAGAVVTLSRGGAA
ncbi:molybdopterin dinucleotide binding domain-containing protein, partial [Angustibacter peucedani]